MSVDTVWVVIDPGAIIGNDTSVWHFAVILDRVLIGERCSIGSGSEIGYGTTIGNDTRISAHVFLPSNSKIGSRVFIGPGAVFTDDRYPRAGNKDYFACPPVIEDDASIGAGAVILPGVRIGRNAMVGAGSVVTHDVAENQIVRGQPARWTGEMRVDLEPRA